MAIEYAYGDIHFHIQNKNIHVVDGVSEITCQEIYDACRLFEAEVSRTAYETVCVASGKESLGGGKQVGLTLTLINDWRLHFGDYAGPDIIVKTVSGGNLLAQNQYQNVPVAPSTFTTVVIAQDTSASTVEVPTSGLTASESAQLAEIIVLKKLMRNKMITDPNTGVITVFDDDGTSVLLQANIYEDAAAATAYRGRGMERRERLE